MMRSDVVGRHDLDAAPQQGPGERCDRCCAAACSHIILASGLDLVFCAHHAREFELALRDSGALVLGSGLRL